MMIEEVETWEQGNSSRLLFNPQEDRTSHLDESWMEDG